MNQDGRNKIHNLAHDLNIKEMIELHKKNPSDFSKLINQKDKDGNTPIHIALKKIIESGKNNYEIITHMIEKLGADPNIPNKNDEIVLHTYESDKYQIKSDSIKSIPSPPHPSKLPSYMPPKQNTSTSTQTEKQIDPELITFLKKLNTKYNQKGGDHKEKIYSGRRIINGSSDNEFITKKSRNSVSESEFESGSGSASESASEIDLEIIQSSDRHLSESGRNDSFVIKSKRSFSAEDIPNRFIDSNQDGGRRDPEITNRYNEILKKIMELLDLDEKTAKDYRSLIKLYLESQHPELRGVANDALKIQEIEKIVADKEKLKSYWENKVKPNMKELTKHIQERTQLSEQRRKEKIEKKKQKRLEKKKEKKAQYSSDSTSTSDSASESDKPVKKTRSKKDSVSSSASTSEEATKKTKSKKEEKVSTTEKKKKAAKKKVENGYIRSDELIFSSERY